MSLLCSKPKLTISPKTLMEHARLFPLSKRCGRLGTFEHQVCHRERAGEVVAKLRSSRCYCGRREDFLMSIQKKIEQSIHDLRPFLVECVHDVQGLLGPRDEQFCFPKIRSANRHGPYTDSSKHNLAVVLPESSLSKCDLTEARWHIAHESIHVLDPHSNPTNYLEEGLATWFQNTKVDSYTGPRWYPWAEAEKRVKSLMDTLPNGLRRFRDEQRRLRLRGDPYTKLGDIAAELLIRYCPETRATARLLIERFPMNPCARRVDT